MGRVMADPQTPEGRKGDEMTDESIKTLVEARPYAWVIPGDDHEDMNGFIDARISEEGEFTNPLYDAAALTALQAERDALKARAEAAEAALTRAVPTTASERDVLLERSRQVLGEGWDEAHDDAHTESELSIAAACYALLSAGWSQVALWEIWPKKWGVDWLKDCDPRRAKVKAAALLIADIERLDRSTAPPADLAKGVADE